MGSTTAILAVALGLMPVPEGASQKVRVDDSVVKTIGRYTESVDRQGRTHLRGFHPRTMEPFDVIVGQDGHVEGNVGQWVVTFHVATS